METPNIWDFNLDGMRKGTWWWWFWLFFWENPENPDRPKQLMVLWSTKNDPKIMCNDLLIDNHSIDHTAEACSFGGTVAAWYYNGKEMKDEILLGNSPMTVQSRPKRMLSSEKPVKTVFSEPSDGTFRILLGDDFEFTAKVLDDGFSRLSYHKGDFLKGRFDYRMTRMHRLSLGVKEKGVAGIRKGTAYFQKVQVNAPIPPWHWGIFHFDDYTLTYYRPSIGSAALAKNLFNKDPLSLNKGLKSSIKLHDHKNGKTYMFNKIKVETLHAHGGLPIFKVACKNRTQGRISFTVEPYSEAVWRFRKRIANVLIHSNVHYQEYPARITSFDMEASDGRRITLADTGIGVGNAEDNVGFLI